MPPFLRFGLLPEKEQPLIISSLLGPVLIHSYLNLVFLISCPSNLSIVLLIWWLKDFWPNYSLHPRRSPVFQLSAVPCIIYPQVPVKSSHLSWHYLQIFCQLLTLLFVMSSKKKKKKTSRLVLSHVQFKSA